MSSAQYIEIIGTFKKGVPFTLNDMKNKFGADGGKMFLVGVFYGLIEPSGNFKHVYQDLTTPYFVFV